MPRSVRLARLALFALGLAAFAAGCEVRVDNRSRANAGHAVDSAGAAVGRAAGAAGKVAEGAAATVEKAADRVDESARGRDVHRGGKVHDRAH